MPMSRHIRANTDDRFVHELTSNVPGDEDGNDPALFSAGERITILLLGIDRRGGGSFVSRTDTMMLLSIHPGRKSAAILSIPRDLYVDIPGYGQDRINTAFVYGSESDNPAGGAALTIQTVEENLGVSIDHYVLVNFNVVIRTIDALGGIDINVPYTIDDPTFPDTGYGYDPLYISEGLHHFDGATALKYARTRHQDNDFYRAQRQQQLMFAVWRKILNMGLDDLIRQGPVIYRQVSSGVFTDLSLKEILLLAQSVGEISTDDIRSEVLDYDYVFDQYTETGTHVLLMNEKAFGLIGSLFHDK
jgi:LCP family protein required for cell wall assembly